MDNIKKINVQDLGVSSQNPTNTYLGLDSRGNLIRTRINTEIPDEVVTESELEDRLSDIDVTVDLSDYYTKGEVNDIVSNIESGGADLSNYYTKEDINNMGFAHSDELAAKQDELISGENIKTINGESILGQGDIQISGGSSDSECIVIEYVGDYIVTNYDTGEETHYNYVGSDRQRHNLEAIQKILKGNACAVYYQYLLEQVDRYDEELGYNCNPPTWITMPLTYRYPSHDGIARFMSVAQKQEYADLSGLITVGLCLNEDDASIYVYNVVDIPTGGSSGGNELYAPTIYSPEIVGEMSFRQDSLERVDISNYVLCDFKAQRTQSTDLWVNNLHLGNGDGYDSTDSIKIASTFYNANEYVGEDSLQEVYAEFTTSGIKEMGVYLSDKYATKEEIGNINNILTSI